MAENQNQEKLELEPITPEKYPEELNKLAEEVKEIEEGKRDDFSPEFSPPKPKDERLFEKQGKDAPIVGEAAAEEEKVQEISAKEDKEPAMAATVGDVLVSKSGTRRKVTGFRLGRQFAGGGELSVETTREGKTSQETISFEQVREARRKGVVTVESAPSEESAEKLSKETVSSNQASMEKTKTTPRKRRPRNAPFEEVEPEPEIAPFEEVEPEKTEETLPKPIPEGRLPVSQEEAEASIPPWFKDGEEPSEPLNEKPSLAEGQPVNPHFESEGVLNDPEFLKFLAEYPDSEHLDPEKNKIELEYRHRVFESQKKFGPVFVEFYERETAGPLGLPVDQETKEKLLEAFKKESVRDLEGTIKKAQEILQYDRVRAALKEYDGLLASLGGLKNRSEALVKLGMREEDLRKEKLEKKVSVGIWRLINPAANPLSGWLFRRIVGETGQQRGWREGVQRLSREERKAFFNEIDKRIEELAGQRAALERFDDEQARSEFNSLREELFKKFEPARALAEVLQRKAIEHFTKILEKPKSGPAVLKQAEEARVYIERMRLGKEMFDGWESVAPEELEGEVDKRLGRIVERLVRKHIGEFKIGNRPLEEMYSEFDRLVSRETDPRSKDFILPTIIKAIDEAVGGLQKLVKARKPESAKEQVAKIILLQAVRQKLLHLISS